MSSIREKLADCCASSWKSWKRRSWRILGRSMATSRCKIVKETKWNKTSVILISFLVDLSMIRFRLWSVALELLRLDGKAATFRFASRYGCRFLQQMRCPFRPSWRPGDRVRVEALWGMRSDLTLLVDWHGQRSFHRSKRARHRDPSGRAHDAQRWVFDWGFSSAIFLTHGSRCGIIESSSNDESSMVSDSVELIRRLAELVSIAASVLPWASVLSFPQMR